MHKGSIPNRSVGPAAHYKHDHPPIRDINTQHVKSLTFGQRIADRVAAVVGGWPFIITQSVLLLIWIGFNIWLALHPALLKAWDPYPFILLNLMLSFQAAYTGPIVMMSQNRQSEIDRLMAQSDFECNTKAEEEVRILMDHLAHQDEIMLEMLERLIRLETGSLERSTKKSEES